MGVVFLFLLIGTAAYLMYRRGRGPGEQPTVWQDARSLLRYAFKGSKNEPDHRGNSEFGRSSSSSSRPSQPGGLPQPARPLFWDRDGHSLESDHSLTNDDRAEEIVQLNELWNHPGSEQEHDQSRKES